MNSQKARNGQSSYRRLGIIFDRKEERFPITASNTPLLAQGGCIK
jgi:hypothetical protein